MTVPMLSTETLARQALSTSAPRVSQPSAVGHLRSAANGGTPEPLSWQAAAPGSLGHLIGGDPLDIIVPRTIDTHTDPRRCDCAEYLRRIAEQQATGSRDFGRGYMHAARLLSERAA